MRLANWSSSALWDLGEFVTNSSVRPHNVYLPGDVLVCTEQWSKELSSRIGLVTSVDSENVWVLWT